MGMKRLEIRWEVDAAVYVPEDTDVDALRTELANKHRPDSYNPYGEDAQIHSESFGFSIIDGSKLVARMAKAMDAAEAYSNEVSARVCVCEGIDRKYAHHISDVLTCTNCHLPREVTDD